MAERTGAGPRHRSGDIAPGSPAQWHRSDHGEQLQPVRRLGRSREGARMEHPDPLNAGQLCFVVLPPVLGRGTLHGRIGWTRLQRREQTLEGARQRYYQSGLSWAGLTPEQQSALTAALQRLTAAEGPPPSD